MDQLLNTSKLAQTLFDETYNCAQSVLKALNDVTGLDDHLTEAISAGFGGGMGKHQEICGAITGASMAISHSVYKLYDDKAEGKEAASEAVKAFMIDFKREMDHLRCIDLTQTDFSRPEEKEAFVEAGGREKICMEAVCYAAQTAAKIIYDYKEAAKA
ncbi:C-GCAxxG-C-C family protein [Fusibacter sp. JL216-2]|uniref:C-GCAxxG-C-C family protein n=1 Tax=Fusibacter sp. JL216-2 TaxID=3071453 RepID=UPI003D338678